MEKSVFYAPHHFLMGTKECMTLLRWEKGTGGTRHMERLSLNVCLSLPVSVCLPLYLSVFPLAPTSFFLLSVVLFSFFSFILLLHLAGICLACFLSCWTFSLSSSRFTGERWDIFQGEINPPVPWLFSSVKRPGSTCDKVKADPHQKDQTQEGLNKCKPHLDPVMKTRPGWLVSLFTFISGLCEVCKTSGRYQCDSYPGSLNETFKVVKLHPPLMLDVGLLILTVKD